MEFIAELGLWLITPLFKLCAFAFKIFMILAQSDVLREVQYGKLLTNFYIILGLVMLFIMAFALLRGIVNPDDQKQGTTVVKNVIINFVISCVMLGFLPTVFPFLFDVQDSILRYNVIGGFFGYGYTGGQEIENPTNSTNEVEASAYRLVNGIFTAFFNVSDDYCKNFLSEGETSGDSDKVYEGKSTELMACQESLASGKNISDNGKTYKDSFLTYKLYVDATGQFGVYSAFSSQAAEGSIEFNFLALLVAGLLLLYVGVSYCFDMGLRLIKLIFYQLIAPIPIFLRVVPNNKISGTFNQWLKVTLTCWMEVFVRIFIFCFCTWLCSALLSTNFLTVDVLEYGKLTGLVTQAFILMAVVMFMKRSPKLISEITGIDSGNMKLGIREKLKDGGAFVLPNAVGGAIAGGVGGGALSAFTGALSGAKHGWKNADLNGIGNAYAKGYNYREARRLGASPVQIWADKFRRGLGLPTWVEMQDERIKRRTQPVTNNSDSTIQYNLNGETIEIKPGQNVNLTYEGQEAIATRKAELESAISDVRNLIERLTKEVDERKTISEIVSLVENEAFGDMDKGKVRGIAFGIARGVIEDNGKYYIEDGNGGTSAGFGKGDTINIGGQDYTISNVANGRAYYKDSSGKEKVIEEQAYFNGSYDSFKKWVEKQTPDMIERINTEEARLNTAKSYINDQYNDKSNNEIKNTFENGFRRLAEQQNGIQFQKYVVDENGRYEFNTDGSRKVATETVKVEKSIDGSYKAYRIDESGSHEITGNAYDVFDQLKKIVKEDARVKNDEAALARESIKGQEDEIKAIDWVNSSIEKAQAKEKSSPGYKARTASQNYVNKNNGK